MNGLTIEVYFCFVCRIEKVHVLVRIHTGNLVGNLQCNVFSNPIFSENFVLFCQILEQQKLLSHAHYICSFLVMVFIALRLLCSYSNSKNVFYYRPLIIIFFFFLTEWWCSQSCALHAVSGVFYVPWSFAGGTANCQFLNNCC